MIESNEYVQFRPLPMQIVIDQRGLFKKQGVVILEPQIDQPVNQVYNSYEEHIVPTFTQEHVRQLPVPDPVIVPTDDWRPPPRRPPPPPPDDDDDDGGGEEEETVVVVIRPPETDPTVVPYTEPEPERTPPATARGAAKKILEKGFFLYHIGGGGGNSYLDYMPPSGSGCNLKDGNDIMVGNPPKPQKTTIASGSIIGVECQSAIAAGEGWGSLYDGFAGGKLGSRLPVWHVWKGFRSYERTAGGVTYDNKDGSNGHKGTWLYQTKAKYSMGGISLSAADTPYKDFWTPAVGEALHNLIEKTLQDATGDTVDDITKSKYWVWPEPSVIDSLFEDDQFSEYMRRQPYTSWVSRKAPPIGVLSVAKENGKKLAKIKCTDSGDDALSSYYLFPLITLASWYAYNNWGREEFAGIPNLPVTELVGSRTHTGKNAIYGTGINPWVNPEYVQASHWFVIPKITTAGDTKAAWQDFISLYTSSDDYTRDEVFMYIYKTAMRYAVLYIPPVGHVGSWDNKSRWALQMMLVNYCCKAKAIGG